jgi:hypothetical protein
MKVEVVVHCGCGAMFDGMVHDPVTQEARLHLDEQVEAFWHDHTHRCQDPDDELSVEDQIAAIITESRVKMEGSPNRSAMLDHAMNGLDAISGLIVYGRGESPDTTSQSPESDADR